MKATSEITHDASKLLVVVTIRLFDSGAEECNCGLYVRTGPLAKIQQLRCIMVKSLVASWSSSGLLSLTWKR